MGQGMLDAVDIITHLVSMNLTGCHPALHVVYYQPHRVLFTQHLPNTCLLAGGQRPQPPTSGTLAVC